MGTCCCLPGPQTRSHQVEVLLTDHLSSATQKPFGNGERRQRETVRRCMRDSQAIGLRRRWRSDRQEEHRRVQFLCTDLSDNRNLRLFLLARNRRQTPWKTSPMKSLGRLKPLPHFASVAAVGFAATISSSDLPCFLRAATFSRVPTSKSR
jgi:hypothetical protein